jgi:5'(3')-deoxyribonucleotidase
MLIGIDFDSTVAKIDGPWLGRLNKACGTHYQPEDWTDWELSFLTEKERQILFAVFTPDLYEVVEPYRDAAQVIYELARTPGVELVCVTANPKRNAEEFAAAKKRWLRRHVPDLAKHVLFQADKFGLGLDVLVDDAPHHFATADCTAVLVERPWNRGVACDYRFREWSDGRRVLLSLVSQHMARLGNGGIVAAPRLLDTAA